MGKPTGNLPPYDIIVRHAEHLADEIRRSVQGGKPEYRKALDLVNDLTKSLKQQGGPRG